MFFERGTQSSTRHRRLRYLLLFSLRCALLLLLVLAFAEPFVRRPATDTNGRLLLLVVDNSFSMRTGTRFLDAKRQALAVLATKPRSQKAQVIALGGQFEVLTQPTADAAELRSALESIRPGDGHASFGDLGRSIRAMAETTHQPVNLELFSDMQRTAMPANFADMVMPANVRLRLHAVTQTGAAPNWTVASVSAPAELDDPKDPRRSRVQAVIAGFGTPAAEKTISLIVNGRAVASHKISVPVNGRATVEFAPLDIGYGFNRCEVRIEGGDAFPADDAGLFAVRRSDPERVLFVHTVGDTRSPLYFGTALQAAAQGSFVLQSMPTEQVSDLDPSKYAFVVLSDVMTLPIIFEHALEQYVSKGGNVLIALGPGAGHSARIPLWQGNVMGVHEYFRTAGPVTASQVDFTHPAVQEPQPGPDNGGWSEAKFLYAAVVDPRQTRVAVRLSDGTPLLLDKQIGEGHVLLFTSGLENLTNDLPLHPVFVAFVDKTARYLSGTERLSGSRLVDSFVQLRSAAEPIGEVANVEIIDPEGHRPLSLSEARTVQTFRLRNAGFYQIRLANGRDAVIGVNPDRRESDLEPIAQDVLQLWSGSNASPTPEETVAPEAGTKYRRMSLWWYVMLFALVAGVAEIVLASGYMGTQREEA